MPRRRANNQEPVRKRSRNGCDRCRVRKVRCDEAKPVCGQCRAKNYDCLTTVHLKWEEDYQTVGRAFGRAGVWSKHTAAAKPNPSAALCPHIAQAEIPWLRLPHVSSYSFVNATVGGVDDLTTLEYDPDSTQLVTSHSSSNAVTEYDETTDGASLSSWFARRELPGMNMTISRAFQPYTPRTPNPMHSHLLSYYVERLCPMTVPTSVAKSPLFTLVLPFAMSASPTVMDSLLALSACHRSRTDDAFKPAAFHLGNKVLGHLRARLSLGNAHQVAMDTETLVLMMILCQFEIINECDTRWVIHLKGARDLIRVRRQALTHPGNKPESNELVLFTETYFAYQDVIGRTACGEPPAFETDFWTTKGDVADAWLGCSPKLVAAICDITDLSREHTRNPSVSLRPDFQRRAAVLERQLTGLKQRVFSEEDDLLQTSAELKRIAAELYLHGSVNGAAPCMPVVQDHVRHILRLTSVLLDHDVTAGLTWPVFMAAVELDPFEDFEWITEEECTKDVPHHARPFILYALDKMSVSIANISRTRSVIEKVWHSREFDDASFSRETAHIKDSNDWERFVVPFCGNMSLV